MFVKPTVAGMTGAVGERVERVDVSLRDAEFNRDTTPLSVGSIIAGKVVTIEERIRLSLSDTELKDTTPLPERIGVGEGD
jgi:hypothetical protein